MKVKINQAASIIVKAIKAGKVPMLRGSPGTGKSEVIHSIAKDFNLKLIDLRLSQLDPSDLNGFGALKGNRATYYPMEFFPVEGDTIPEGYSGWLIFFDEINSAAPATQAAAYKVVLDRMVGMHKLHKNVAIVAAGNLDTDNAITNEISTALQSRMIHIELEVCPNEWVDWASKSGIDARITSFINFMPHNIYTFEPDHSDMTYACPRTWSFANDLLKQSDINDSDTLPMLAGTVGEGVAIEFVSYCKMYGSLPQLHEIISNPTSALVPQEPGNLYAMTGFLGSKANDENLKPVMEYVSRLPREFQIVTVRETVRRNKAHRKHSAVHKWISDNAEAMF